jgi:competence protein ComEC
LRSLLLLAGVLLALWGPSAWQLPMLLLACLPLLRVRGAPVLVFMLVLGYWHSLQTVQAVQGPALRTPERLLIEARIDSVPQHSANGWQFDAQARFPRRADLLPQRLRLSGLRGSAIPQAGELWQLAVQVTVPAAGAPQRALLRDGVSTAARILVSPLNQRLSKAGPGIDSLRTRVADRIDTRVADPAAAALLAALAVGVTGDVSPQQWRVFSATGVTHLVAISGMHVTFFALLCMGLARLLWRCLATRMIWVRRELFATAVGLVLALGYALLSGFAVPAQRTVIMLTAFLLLRECARTSQPAWSVAVALAVVLLYDPLAALSAGFWLSFLAVAAIVLVAGARLQSDSLLRSALQVQWLVTLALLPATLALFGTFSAVGLAANLVAIPAFTFLLVPPVLLATAGYLLPGAASHWCADQLVDLAAGVASVLWSMLTWSADAPAAVWQAEPTPGWYLLALPALLLALLPVSRGLRALALCALCSVFLLRSSRPAPGELWVDVLDVGASSAVLLRTAQRLVVYGTGEKFGTHGRAFEAGVLPAVQRSGYDAVDLWLPGRPGRDVQAAVLRGAASLPLRRVEWPSATQPPPEFAPCERRAWNWDGIAFHIEPQAGRSCLLTAQVAGRVLTLASEAGAGAALPRARGSVGGDVMLLPRAASAAARVHAPPGAVLVASLSANEWESASWQRLRQQWASSGAVTLTTGTAGGIRLQMTADGRLHRVHPAGGLHNLAASVFGYHARPCGNLC